MRFENLEYLWLLLLVPVIVLLFVYYIRWRNRKLKQLGEQNIIQPLINGYIPNRLLTKFVFTCLGLVMLILGLANPQQPDASITIKRKGIDVVFALDLSKSMLATDIAPTRLERSKQFIKKTLDLMSGNRVGLVVFAGSAYVQVPLTSDFNVMKMYLDNVEPDRIPQQGTVLSTALEVANNSFSSAEKKYKSIVLISDGEDHEDEAIKTTEKINETGTVIHTVGVGNPKGVVLIDPATGEPKKDNEGNPVVTKLNEDILKNISGITSGDYFLLNNINLGAKKLNELLSSMEQMDLGEQNITSYKSYFVYFVSIGMLLVVISLLLPVAYKNKYIK